MARDVYSTQFMVQTGLDTNVGYTVPEGYRAILRDVDVFCRPVPSASNFSIGNPEGGLVWYVANPAETALSSLWRGRQVYNPGDIITFNVITGSYDLMASGYLLELP